MRFKHGHLSNIAVEANGASPVAVGKPCFHLSLENVATAVSEPDGHEQLADLLRAHDAGEALPGDALARVMEALRVFVGAGQLHEQLRQFAQHAGLAEAGAGDSPSLPFPRAAPRRTFLRTRVARRRSKPFAICIAALCMCRRT